MKFIEALLEVPIVGDWISVLVLTFFIIIFLGIKEG